MNGRTLRAAAGLGGLLATAAFGFGIVQGAFAQSDQPVRGTGQEAAQSAPAMPMEQVLAQLRAEGYGEIHEIERDRDRYEVKGGTGRAAGSRSTSMPRPARCWRARKRTKTELCGARSGLSGTDRAPTRPRGPTHAERHDAGNRDRSPPGRSRRTSGRSSRVRSPPPGAGCRNARAYGRGVVRHLLRHVP